MTLRLSHCRPPFYIIFSSYLIITKILHLVNSSLLLIFLKKYYKIYIENKRRFVINGINEIVKGTP